MKTVFQNLKKTDWLLAAVCLAFIALQVWLDLKTPDYMAEITTLVQTAGSTMGEILSAGGMMLVCSLGSLAASVVTAICAARIAATLGATLSPSPWRRSAASPPPASSPAPPTT